MKIGVLTFLGCVFTFDSFTLSCGEQKERFCAEHTVFCGLEIVEFVFVVVLNAIQLINKINKITENRFNQTKKVEEIIRKMTSSSTLPPLPENEKTYAGIPEAVFVVS